MKQVKLSQIIRDLIKEVEDFNPFSENFDQDLFLLSISNKVKGLEHGSKFDDIEVITVFNSLYEKIMLDIEKLIEEINLDTNQLVEELLLLTNHEVLASKSEMIRNLPKRIAENNDELPKDINDYSDFKIQNSFGQDMNVNDLIDKNVDIIDELISIIYDIDIRIDRSLPTLDEKHFSIKIQKLRVLTNLLVNIKECLGLFLYEFSEFSYLKNKIVEKCETGYYFKKIAGKDRNRNLIKEGIFYGIRYIEKSRLKVNVKVPLISVSSGEVLISNKSDEIDPYELALSISIQSVFYFHLNFYKIKALGKITIREIIIFLTQLKQIFRKVNPKIVIDRIDSKTIPIKIKKKTLVKFLKRTTKLNESTVRKLLKRLTQTSSNFSSFWSNPLLSIGEYYHFVIPSISYFNDCYLLDILIKPFVPHSIQERLLKKLVIDELRTKQYHNYQLSVIDSKLNKFEKINADNFFIIALKYTVIYVQIVVIDFPIDHKGYKNALDRLAKANIVLKGNVENLKVGLNEILPEHKTKKKVGLLLTNHTSLSGINLNGCQIIDINLFNNYFKTGKYERNIVIPSEKIIQPDSFASITYYQNEEEFNSRFLFFLYYPDPIIEKIKRYRIKEYPVGIPKMSPQIFVEAVEYISLSEVIWDQVNEFEFYLRQLYYFEKEYDEVHSRDPKLEIERRIKFIIPQIFDLVSFYKKDKDLRIRLLNIFKDVGTVGIGYLIYSFQNSLELVSLKRVAADGSKVELLTFIIDNKKASQQLDNILNENFRGINKPKNIRPSSFNLTHSLNTEDFQNLVKYIEQLFGIIEIKFYSENELNNFLFIITIYLGLINGEEEEYKGRVSNILTNFIDLLNFNHHYQKARDFCEEILVYSLQREKIPSTGWICLFKCFTQQKNVVDAALYGCLSLAIINRYGEHKKEILLDAFYHSMIFFRNFGFEEMVEITYKILMGLELEEYDRQKITLSYYNSVLLNPSDITNEFIEELEQFISETFSSIISFNKNGIIPWLVLLYNLKNCHIKGLIDNFEKLQIFIDDFEKEIDDETIQELKSRLFPIEKETKKVFKEMVKKVFETRNYEDLAFEINELKLITTNVVSLSLNPVDIEYLLLSNLFICDNSLSFYEIEEVEVSKFFQEENSKLNKKIENYSKYIFNNLNLEVGQVLYWIFENNNHVYCLIINHNNEYSVEELIEWDIKKMRVWLSKIADFYFDDRGDYPINSQEQDFLKILKEVKFACVPNAWEYDEIFIFSTLDLAIFPHNLISSIVTNNQPSLEAHEIKVKNYIQEKGHQDFISFHKPITNVISPEWFIQNSQKYEIKKSEFSIGAWIPIEDEDFAIHTSYSKLKNIIEDDYNGTIYTESKPESKLNSTVNIFLAHGGKGFEGFRALYTKEGEEGKAITKGEGVSRLFGKGIIAIIFVCDSASISKEIYSERLNTFTYQILSLGYQAVIAPAWSLSTDIPSAWLGGFVDSFTSGDKLSVAVYKANKKISREGYNEYHGFYSPTGWTTLHLYGNPNIIVT